MKDMYFENYKALMKSNKSWMSGKIFWDYGLED